jgi:hypothetical protein
LPNSHSWQEELVDAVEYFPASHCLQVIAPPAAPVSVIQPAVHSEQYDWPSSFWYLPASQGSHIGSFVNVWYSPFGHGWHVLLVLLAYLPGMQSEQ